MPKKEIKNVKRNNDTWGNWKNDGNLFISMGIGGQCNENRSNIGKCGYYNIQDSKPTWLTSYWSSPGVVAHSRLGLIVLRLGAGGSTDRRIGEVHVRWHRGRVGWAIRLRVGEVMGRSR
jgi:hypothetical protein